MATIQKRLDILTKKWWFYLIILIIFFLPSYSSLAYDPRHTSDLITAVLSQPLIYSFPLIMPIFKLVPILLVLALIIWGDKITRLFDIYAAITITLFALFQNMAVTKVFGFAALVGNVVVYLLVAFFWFWESIIKNNVLILRGHSLWRYWVVPVAFLGFWFPVNPANLGPEFSISQLFANSAGLTTCMMLPVYMAILTLCYPSINRSVLRVTCFAGFITACLNLMQWFLFSTQTWMGIMHFPLLTISLYGLILSFKK